MYGELSGFFWSSCLLLRATEVARSGEGRRRQLKPDANARLESRPF